MRIIKDFRGHIKERQEPTMIQYFRYASYALWVVLIITYGIS